MAQPIWHFDAFALAEKLREQALDPLELLQVFQKRIDQHNPRLNAIVTPNRQAGADARASTERYEQRKPLSLIDGIPIAVKDNLVVKGLAATMGSNLYADYLPTADEIPVERLRRAGAVIVGKTNVPEFCVEGYTDNELFGLTCNPWDLSTTPGGSSGGSVSSVAAALVPFAVGTDGGGSIRRPAAYTNLVGLKPTIGRIPRGGGLPQLLLDMEVVGPLTRSVRDQAILFDVLAGPDKRDHRSLKFQAGNALQAIRKPPESLNILAVERFGAEPLDPLIAASFRQTVERLRALGHHLHEGVLPLNIEPVNARWPSIGATGLALLLERNPRMRDLAGSKYVEWASQDFKASALLETIETIGQLRDDAAQAFEAVDIIMTPSCAAMPWSTDVPFPAQIDGQDVGPRGSAIYTGWVNACGHPAVSIPGPLSPAGMPIGIQFVGGLGQDETLLQLAAQMELAHSWLDQRPGGFA